MTTEGKPKQVLVLRCCKADMSSTNGFVWPTSGLAEAQDWNPKAVCGYGLHGWLWGEGDASASDWVNNPDAKWLVVSVDENSIVELGRKVKFPRGEVVVAGTREEATSYIRDNGGLGKTNIGGTATAGARGTATAGEKGTIAIRYWCQKKERYRVAVGEVGEDGIEPNTAYVVDDGKLVKKRPINTTGSPISFAS